MNDFLTSLFDLSCNQFGALFVMSCLIMAFIYILFDRFLTFIQYWFPD